MSEFEKKILEFKENIKVAKNLSELTKISSEIFGKNGIINLEFKKRANRIFFKKIHRNFR